MRRLAALRLDGGLLAASAAFAVYGILSPGAWPLRTASLLEAAREDTALTVQAIEAGYRLRPWHPGYRDTRAALRRLEAERRLALATRAAEDRP